MRYFYDCEFLEGTQKRRFVGYKLPPLFDTKSTIDLISIGIVAEDGRELYCISKDFNLEEAWNRYDEKVEVMYGDMRNRYPEGRRYKEYWIRENVLKPIFNEWKMNMNGKIVRLGFPLPLNEMEFNYKNFKYCISVIGKSNKKIAEEIKEFIYAKEDILYNHERCSINDIGEVKSEIKLFGYYSSYDHVCLAWLFGKMIDLPNGFPMYTIDLNQMLDSLWYKQADKIEGQTRNESWLKTVKSHPNYPKQTNEHSAICDARWNKELYEFLQSL